MMVKHGRYANDVSTFKFDRKGRSMAEKQYTNIICHSQRFVIVVKFSYCCYNWIQGESNTCL